MPESQLIIAIDNDDHTPSINEMQSSISPDLSKNKRTRLTFPFGPCRVCSDSATGVHYGIATCEGCKGFFKRSILRKEKYRCYFDSTCLINVTNRNRCKACRFRRCIDEGMSVDGVKMGRIPKLVKERALNELKEQKMKDAANESHAGRSSCSSVSDRSIENDDPNVMEADSMESQVSPAQPRAHPYTNDSTRKNLSDDSGVYTDFHQSKNSIDSVSQSSYNNEEKTNSAIVYRTRYPTFLSADFGTDVSDDLPGQATGLLTSDAFKHVITIAKKLSATQSNYLIDLDEDETIFIKYLRWSAYNVFLRRSNRSKQLTYRMNQMIERNIQEYPGDGATQAECLNSILFSCQVYVRSTVVYTLDLPGMKNMSLESLQSLIARRTFDWFLLKYYDLYNENGQSYFVAPNGFQFTRSWNTELHGAETIAAMFDFCQHFRDLNLNESEFSIVFPLHMCYHDSSIEDHETLRMLRSCYLYALYTELCENRGDIEGRLMCSKVLQTLERLIPINERYQKNFASRVLAE